ncbi:7-cyano-7-deazaguanine synthase [Mycobacterium sp. 360MFTsu5.1]|uniref:7-cyano-7-deazaguanine synthase n=1 Tax=Mycobacterium sp. 360MFTsu5.1 TaxID=1172186 RepID=UPI000374303E|nr:7-cyano-7-deazaguanine synthase [Mycobacterium sp. 360MFTsu5.1]
MKRLLLLSGGLDSAGVAAMVLPEHCLYVDYGQLPAMAEGRAARQIAAELGLPFDALSVSAAAVGGGLMATDAGGASPAGVSPEWWPFRNQLLITLAAAWGVQRGFEAVLVGTVASDGARHADGTSEFVAGMDALLALQEGGMRLRAPAAHLRAAELLSASRVSDAVIGWTHSCHRANLPCANCPGCVKHIEALREAGRLQ